MLENYYLQIYSTQVANQDVVAFIDQAASTIAEQFARWNIRS